MAVDEISHMNGFFSFNDYHRFRACMYAITQTHEMTQKKNEEKIRTITYISHHSFIYFIFTAFRYISKCRYTHIHSFLFRFLFSSMFSFGIKYYGGKFCRHLYGSLGDDIFSSKIFR